MGEGKTWGCLSMLVVERGTTVDVRIIVETTFENGTTKRHRLGRLSRPFRRTQPEGFGLLLEDAKTILGQLQNAILRDQIEEISEASCHGNAISRTLLY
jgi:hypothetical protein